MKHPVLQEYTLEELAWEYYSRIERELYEKEQLEHEDDKIEEEKAAAVDEWIDQMEKEEAEKSGPASPPSNTPTADDEWMQQYIEKAKAEHGESFGEDIVEEF